MIRDPWKPQNLLISQLLGRNKKIASIGPIRIPIWHSLQKIKFLALAVWSGPFRGSKNRRSPSNTKKPVVVRDKEKRETKEFKHHDNDITHSACVSLYCNVFRPKRIGFVVRLLHLLFLGELKQKLY